MGACESSESGSNSNNIGDLLDSMLNPNEVTSETRITDLETKVTNRLIRKSSINNNDSINVQNLVITYSDSYEDKINDPFFRKSINIQKGPFGMIEKCGPIDLYFCNYDITQRLSLNVRQFNENISEESEHITEEIINHMKKEAEITYSDDPGKLDVTMKAIDETRERVFENVNENISNINNQFTVTGQNLEIEIRDPIRCKLSCNPESPEITQDAQVEIISSQIITSSIKIIEEELKNRKLEVSDKLDTTNKACILMLSIILCSCFICLIIVWTIISMASK
jgi:hypothetical protein